MKPVNFKEANIVLAKDQPEYQPLPAHRDPDASEANDIVTTCWELSDEEMQQVIRTRKIWVHNWCFKKPFYPIALQAMTYDHEQMEKANKGLRLFIKTQLQEAGLIERGRNEFIITKGDNTINLNEVIFNIINKL